jgi:hypothetical protein
MSIVRRLRTIACCAILEIGTLMGVPMRPEQIQDLMRAMNAPKLAQTNPDECATGDAAHPDATTGLQ